MANLLDKASIILTPTGYSNGTIHNLKPGSAPFGDCAAGCATSSTRVNSSGLVEWIDAGLARIDYEKGYGAILLEPQSTNELLYSSALTISPWTTTGVGVSYISDTSPNGRTNQMISNIFRYSSGTTSGAIQTVSSGATGNGLAVSAWVRNPGSGTIEVWIGWGNIASGDGSFHTVGTSWQKIKHESTSGIGSNTFHISPPPFTNVRVWGCQFEKTGNGKPGVVTSTILTSSTTVTRGSELINGGGGTALINSPSGTMFFEGSMMFTGVNVFFGLTNSDKTQEVRVYGTPGGGISGRIITPAGAKYFGVGWGGSRVSNSKLAVKWDGVNIKAFINGSLTTTTTMSQAFEEDVLDTIRFSDGQRFYGWIKQFIIFKEALSDAEIIALTT